MIYPYNIILLGNKKGHTDACYNMNETWKHYDKWKYKRPYTVRFHLNKVSRIGKFTKAESGLVVAIRIATGINKLLSMGFLLGVMKILELVFMMAA